MEFPKSSNLSNHPNHYCWLDLIRFTAAFLVLACHYRGHFFEEYSLLPESNHNVFNFAFFSVTRLGAEAVLIFFVLSGFLVGGGGISKCMSGSFNPGRYVIDRTVRIMLPLISALLLCLIVIGTVLKEPIMWDKFLMNLLSLQGVFSEPITAPLWSLSYEVWFYILFGCSAVLISKRLSYPIFFSTFVLLIISLMIFTKLSPHYLFIWFMGAIAYVTKPFKKNKLIFWASGILSIILITSLQLTIGSNFAEISISYTGRCLIEMTFAFAFCIFLQQVILFKPKSKYSNAINNIGTKLAAFSYTLYLTHIPVMDALKKFGFPKSESVNLESLTLYVLEIIIALVSAYLIYLLFEKNTYKVKKFISKRLLGEQ